VWKEFYFLFYLFSHNMVTAEDLFKGSGE
jgi:hypothetical protein